MTTGFVPTKEQVFEFLQDPVRPHGVLSYLDKTGHPLSAFVAFSATPSLAIIFGTSDHQSRKYQRLLDDQRVSFNVTDPSKRYTVQLQGFAKELTRDELKPFELHHYAKLGEASKRFKELPDQHFFIITPMSVRFNDCLEEPWTVTEV